ncbi:prepilin-type N-terminal cleavage/methylation domain-containing protein [Cardiobacteriaceae bacterium TAE3-ERU3]|nr:prepilin-type N-terminal cleavage/methylation domain-containing protein [Cardiobacteriaceae bacterium TAE3-ERU3]
MKKMNSYKGLSLIEILIALLVSSVIMIAIMNLYSGFYSSNREQNILSSTQDKANFALNELSRQIRMSGAGLCVKPVGEKLLMNPSFDAVDKNLYSKLPLLENNRTYSDMRLRSFANMTDNDLNTSLELPNGSEALLMTYSLPTTLQILDVSGPNPLGGGDIPTKENRSMQEEMSTSRFHDLVLSSPLSTIIKTKETKGVSGSTSGDKKSVAGENQWLMVSDCDYTEIVYYPVLSSDKLSKNILPAPNNKRGGSAQFMHKHYHTGQVGLVSGLASKIYFVAKGSDGLALYEKDLLADDTNNATNELIDGVASMNIEYLYEDPVSGETAWHTTDERNMVNNWNKNLPVKITLIMADDNGRRPFVRVIDPRN